jgi:hypothetical protein
MIKDLIEKIKIWRNSFKIPSLLSFIISKDGKINPTLEETLKTAPAAQDNWERLGLGKVVFGKIKVWHLIALPIVMIVVRFSSEALQFFIQIISQAVMLLPLSIILYFLIKSFKK